MMQFQTILDKALQERPLAHGELVRLLAAAGEECTALHAAARTMRKRYFGEAVFAYGFVYFSTYCRNNCTFCDYRRDNAHGLRYRKTLPEILEISRELEASGVHLLDLTMGEDPHYMGSPETIEELLSMAASVKRETGLPIMFSPGVLPLEAIEHAGALGLEWYACYQETHNRELFRTLRGDQSYRQRLDAKQAARAAGMLVEEGVLAGVGETLSDIADSIAAMGALGAAQVRVMSFVPQSGAPLQKAAVETDSRELNTIAVMRLALRDRLIPASLDVAGNAGLRERLDAGANVVTSIIAPRSGLAGVSNPTLDVENGQRTISGIAGTLTACGLHLGTHQEYQQVMTKLRMECGCSERVGSRRATAGC